MAPIDKLLARAANGRVLKSVQARHSGSSCSWIDIAFPWIGGAAAVVLMAPLFGLLRRDTRLVA